MEKILAICHRLMFSCKCLDFQRTHLISSLNMTSKANGFQVVYLGSLAVWTAIKLRNFALRPDDKVTQKTALERNDVSLLVDP